MLCTKHLLYSCFISLCVLYTVHWSVYGEQVEQPTLWNGMHSKIIDHWTVKWGSYAKFYAWNCTAYAASRRPDIFPSRNGKDRPFGWNAIERYKKAKYIGLPTGKLPWTWAIAVYAWWRGASSSYWHVAIVERIVDDNTIEVTDMNYLWLHIVTKRIVKSNLAIWYIYKKQEKSDMITNKIVDITIRIDVNENTYQAIQDITDIDLPTTNTFTTESKDSMDSIDSNNNIVQHAWHVDWDNRYPIIDANQPRHLQDQTIEDRKPQVWLDVNTIMHNDSIELSG